MVWIFIVGKDLNKKKNKTLNIRSVRRGDWLPPSGHNPTLRCAAIGSKTCRAPPHIPLPLYKKNQFFSDFEYKMVKKKNKYRFYRLRKQAAIYTKQPSTSSQEIKKMFHTIGFS